ncbi:hypothetical protein XELAEV_18016118mg [Xenopus laevis]|uniref:Helix-turn-helix domain-containing protein n=1 Tax=Xenopus laevis TaxID=8355 RepID=A0A974DLQ1_XENLA|nr:hypothetical protein XELAEV_18016118mg [Xenopus laevis]
MSFADIGSLTTRKADTLAYTQAEVNDIISRFSTNLVNFETDKSAQIQRLEFLSKMELSLQLHSDTLIEFLKVKRIRPTLCEEDYMHCKNWEKILNKCSLDLMALTIEGIQTKLSKLRSDITELKQNIQATYREAEFDDLLVKLKDTVDKHQSDLCKVKLDKLKRDTIDYQEDRVYNWKRPFIRKRPYSSTRQRHRRKTRRGRKRKERDKRTSGLSDLNEDEKSIVVNISRRTLTEPEICVLNKGLGYVPTYNGDKLLLDVELEIFFRTLRLKAHFAQDTSDKDRLPSEEDDSEDSQDTGTRILRPGMIPTNVEQKIHKDLQKPPGRPTVAGMSSIFKPLATLLDSVLNAIVVCTKSYVRDTTDFINKLGTIAEVPNDAILCTMDVSSLYTSIPHGHGIDTIVLAIYVIVELKEGILATDIYGQDRITYLDPRSFHHPATTKGLPYSQLLRVRRIVSTEDKFEERTVEMMTNFKSRGYGSKLLDEAKEKAKNKPRSDLLCKKTNKKSNRLPFVTTYSTQSGYIKEIIHRHWHLLQMDQKLKPWVADFPMMAYKRANNLRDQLVHALSEPIEKQGTWLSGTKGMYRCGRCVNSNFVTWADRFYHPRMGREYPMKDYINCQSDYICSIF